VRGSILPDIKRTLVATEGLSSESAFELTSMARKTNKSKKQQQPARGRSSMMRPVGLDKDAMCYRRLLSDPCAAPLCRSVFSGLGGSLQVRLKRSFTFHPQAVEGYYCFVPSSNLWFGQYNSAASAGGSFTLSTSQQMFDNTTSDSVEWRCTAGCLKIRYIGSESARSGLVGVFPNQGPFYEPGTAGLFVTGVLSQTPVVYRTGEVLHEAKFVPTDGDQLFTDTRVLTLAAYQSQGSVCVVFQNCPAGSIVAEWTGVYEIEGASLFGTFNTMVAPQPSPSRNTLNEVLRSFGDGLSWAYSNVAVPVIKSSAANIARSLVNTRAVSTAGPLLLTM